MRCVVEERCIKRLFKSSFSLKATIESNFFINCVVKHAFGKGERNCFAIT